jgi:PPK2 family polyphosphate:nucleotide phosphotransferase
MALSDTLRVKPGSKVRLGSIDPASTPGLGGKNGGGKNGRREKAERELAENVASLAALQQRLYAENKRAVLVVLQGMDTSGKDGVIRRVFSGLNPQGCHVTSFKKPSEDEADRDFLWRIHAAVPPKGDIGVFNRAHYEDVLIVRVRGLVSAKVWEKRYDQINDFERYLVRNGVTLLKVMLHISKEEQLERLRARLADPTKNWKFSPQDLEERKRWGGYMEAYEAALARCSTSEAPWHVVPADRKWYRDWAVSTLLRETLEKIDPKIPPAKFDVGAFRLE